jgi:5-methyltetrahydropteroyltriglutamate--homocysteine methyltransferase
VSAAVLAFCPGIYARSEELVQATRDLDRGRTTAAAVEEVVERDLEALLAAEREAGLDLLSDGMLRWQDLFRPLVEAANGLEPGPLTRFLDTNTFYRAPCATSAQPRLTAPLGEPYLPPLLGPNVVTLPSPYALAYHTGLAPRRLAEGVLAAVVGALPSDVELVVLAEPFLGQQAEPDLDPLIEALDALAGGRPLALQLVFADAGPLLARGLDALPVEGVGVDFYRTALDDVPAGFAKLLLAGVVDARSPALEEPDDVASFVRRLAERGCERVALVPNGDLQFVPEPLAREKVLRLGRARNLAGVEVAV